MKTLILLTILLTGCSSIKSNKQQRNPAVELEKCFDVENNQIACINKNKCYITNISNSFEQEIDCNLYKELRN
jgi:uncharacterized protein YceK